MAADTNLPPPLLKGPDANPVVELREILRAVHVMKMYASAEGLALPEAARTSVAALAPVEAAVAQLDPAQPDLAEGIDLMSSLGAALLAHAELSKVVAPATPDSIVYTQPPANIWDFMRRQLIIFLLIVLSGVSILGYLTTLFFATLSADTAASVHRVGQLVTTLKSDLDKLEQWTLDAQNLQPEISQGLISLEKQSVVIESAALTLPARLALSWPRDEFAEGLVGVKERPLTAPQSIARSRAVAERFLQSVAAAPAEPVWRRTLLLHLKNVFAAMLGAAFYTLYTANTYIVRRTFDRAYTIHYVVRFVLGVVAGVILANFGEYVLTGNLSAGADTAGIILTQTVLALLGGYSADAVNAIFTRVAETLTTLVRGDQSKVAQAQAEANSAVGQASLIAEELAGKQELLAKAIEEGASQSLIEAIRANIKMLGDKLRTS